jgi:anti-sigma-K factor RskA
LNRNAFAVDVKTKRRSALFLCIMAAREVLQVQEQLVSDEQRQHVSHLQTQIDRLSQTLQQWQQTQEQLQPMEQRLARLTEQWDQILTRWMATDRRHAEAAGQLEARLTDWSAMEMRLQQDASEKMRQVKQTIEQEWEALRQVHEEPARQLREQAANLSETCVAAAHSALSVFERAEARIAALETDLHGRMNQLSLDVHAAIGELRGTGARPAALAPFPLESVMRIHEGLRDSSESAGKLPQPADPAHARETPPAAKTVASLPESSALTQRIETLERANEEARENATRAERMWRTWQIVLAVTVVALAAAAIGGVILQRRVEARLNEAASRVAAAQQQATLAGELADKRIAATRQDAEQRIQQARQTAEGAQVISGVLAAPDLIRFNLIGQQGAPRAFAQALWSRSRGLVFSGSRLPALQAGTTYQLWLLTNTEPVSAGLLTPDAAGRVSLATDTPPTVPRPVIGVSVTTEPAGGRRTPSGVVVLARGQ